MDDKIDNLIHNEELKQYSSYFSQDDATYFNPGQLFVDKDFYHILYMKLVGKEIMSTRTDDAFASFDDEFHYYIKGAIDLRIRHWNRKAVFPTKSFEILPVPLPKLADVEKISPNEPILILNDVAIRIKKIEVDKNTYNMFLKVLYKEKIGWILAAKIEDWTIEPDPMRNRKNFHTTLVRLEQ